MNSKQNFSDYTGKGIKVAIVDSGIDYSHPDIKNVQGGIRIRLDYDGKVLYSRDFNDTIGHGTACAGIIREIAPDVQLYGIKILDDELSAQSRALAEAIRWAVQADVNVVNLSLGTTDKTYKDKLREVCEYANANGVILVAADHNEGRGSYPSIFPNVIGVTTAKCNGKYEYFHRPGHDIDFSARGNWQRLAWVKPIYISSSGNSYAAAHLTGIIALILERNPKATFQQIKEILIANSLKDRNDFAVNGRRSAVDIKEKYVWIKRVTLYPYDDRMQDFIRFKQFLDFEIVGVADIPQRGLIGKDAGEAIGVKTAGVQILLGVDSAIRDADTLIIGYTENLRELLYKAIENGKNIFSFKQVHEDRFPNIFQTARKKGVKIAYPSLQYLNEAVVCKERLFTKVNVPVIGIFNTGSHRNFFVQLTLREKLKQRGYEVSQIGTEPHCELFGFDITLPVACDEIMNPTFKITYLERKIIEICEQRKPDIIITGTHTEIIPNNLFYPSSIYSIFSMEFLFGTKPDAYILTVDGSDHLDYIKDSIDALKVLGKGETILIVLSDKTISCSSTLASLEKRYKIPATEVISEKGQEKLIDIVIDYFAE